MQTATKPVIVFHDATDSSAYLEYIYRATTASIIRSTLDSKAHMPSAHPQLIILITRADILYSCRRIVYRLRDVYGSCPILVAVDRVTNEIVEQLAEAGVDDIISPCTEYTIRSALLRLLHPDQEYVCPPDLLTKVGLMNLLGKSEQFIKAVAQIPHLGQSRAPILIQGETGTGKELFSRAIHYLGNRSQGPFIAVNCGSLSDHLFENELFGHVKGAYTDAHADHRGLVDEASGGTLFLDEINSLTPRAQVKLLRFIESSRYKRVGSAREEPADTRFVFATNVDLFNEMKGGRFRTDLFYRIHVLTLSLPPLRERKIDIPLLAQAFLEDFCREYECTKLFLSPAAQEKLCAHTWPGNVRELRNVIERAAAVTIPSRILRAMDMDIPLRLNKSHNSIESFHEAKVKAIEEFERNYLERVLAENSGNVSQSARSAQKDRRSFQRLLRKHGLGKKE
jgi:two-component system, NtrC family, response regulator GlrR